MPPDLESILANKPKTGRQQSQSDTLRAIHARFGLQPITVVETGCIRRPSDQCRLGDGWSTITWAYWASYTKSHVYVVDINQDHISIAQQILGQFPFVHYSVSDSVAFLNFLPSDFKIDVLFLDSFDTHQSDEDVISAACNHQLKEIEAAYRCLHSKSLVLLDDIPEGPAQGGKGGLSIPWLMERDWKVLHHKETQVLFGHEPN